MGFVNRYFLPRRATLPLGFLLDFFLIFLQNLIDMSFIQLENLMFSYSDSLKPIFSGLNIRFDTDWKLALIGANGVGKTTFLELLCGKLKATSGRISANVNFCRFPCKISDYNKTAYEISEEIAPEAEFWQIEREVNLLGLDAELFFRPFFTLSGGERTKFLLAVLFAGEGFPLLDEPTDHLDLEGRRKLAEYLKSKKGFLVVSHDRAFLDNCCDHILSITNTGTELVRGNYSVWRQERDKKEANDAARRENLERERARLERASEKLQRWADKSENAKWRQGGERDSSNIDRGFVSARAAKIQKRSIAAFERRENAERNIKELLKDFSDREELKIFSEKYFKSELFHSEQLSVTAEGKTILPPTDFVISSGERIAVCGKNGAGKSTFLKVVAGEIKDFSGTLNISPRLKISYVPQIADYAGSLSDYASLYGVDESYFKAILAKFGFDERDFSRDMRNFSEGQKKKAALARSLCERAHLYVWDEPLNYLDIQAREQLAQAVKSSNVSILFVEHDEAFITDVATSVYTVGS